MANKLTEEVLREMVNHLQGTCLDVLDALNSFDLEEENQDELLEFIGDSQEIERCVTCSWWCEMCEMALVSDEYVCEDCRGG